MPLHKRYITRHIITDLFIFLLSSVNLLFMFAVKQRKSPRKITEIYLTDLSNDLFKDAFNRIQANLKGISGRDDLLCGMYMIILHLLRIRP